MLRSSNLHELTTPSLCDANLCDETFKELYGECLPDWLIDKCKECGWVYPTVIQRKVLDSLLLPYTYDKYNDDKDKDNGEMEQPPNSMVIEAQTGSGKTLTYLLPMFARLRQRNAIQAIIVVPTRELGLQVATVAKRLASRKFMVMSLLQGSELRRQRAWAWAETPQAVIGTPNELLDMVQFGGLPRVNSVNYVVVDEVDACLLHESGSSLYASQIPAYPGSGNLDATLASSLHTLLSRYLSPTYLVDQSDVDEQGTILDRLFTGSTGETKRPFLPVDHRQTIFASATIPQRRHFVKQCRANQWTLEEPLMVRTSPGQSLPPSLEHGYMVCSQPDQKLATLRRVLTKIQHKYIVRTNEATNNGKAQSRHQKHSKVLVFFDPTRPMDDIAKVIANDLNATYFRGSHRRFTATQEEGPSNEVWSKPIVSVLRFEETLSRRAGATQAFASDGNFRVLLTSDLGARGLDISGISHVIHFDLPQDADTYLHRSGRTGRLGRTGQVITIVTKHQEFVLHRIANALSLQDLQCIGRQNLKSKG